MGYDAWRKRAPRTPADAAAVERLDPKTARGQRASDHSGIPLDAVISPLFCNVYLHHLDISLQRRRYPTVRYADDFVVFCKRREHVERALRPPWTFTRRARRPPPDPYCGYFHQPRYGRASLALDLMEAFRPIIADSVVLTLINKWMLAPDDFAPGAGGQGVSLDHAGWRTVAAQDNRRLRTLVRPAGQERRISYQKLLEVQARRLRRAIESEAPYQPFLTK